MSTDISIVVSTYNRCESLKNTLDSLLAQELVEGFDYEVIIVDNNSKDMTKKIVESYIPKFNGRIIYVFEANQGVSYARNRGIKEAKGEIIAFTDDDVILDKYWIKNIFICFEKYHCDAIGGRVLPLYNDSTPIWVKQNKDILNGPIPCHDYGENITLYQERMLPFIGANMAFKKYCFVECGLFRIDLGLGKGYMGDDTEFFIRLKRADKKLYYCSNVLVYHKIENSRVEFKYFAKWNIAYGRYLVAEEYRKDAGLVCYWGVPRYIFRRILKELLGILFNFCNKRKFIIYWNKFFIEIGMVIEYRRIFKCQK